MTNEQEADSQSKRHNGTASANLCEDTLLKRCHIQTRSYEGDQYKDEGPSKHLRKIFKAHRDNATIPLISIVSVNSNTMNTEPNVMDNQMILVGCSIF